MVLLRLRPNRVPLRWASASSLRAVAERALVLLVASAIFAVQARWVFTHFSNDGYLFDSGWLAYLFGSGDPLLRNPSVVNEISFYAHHLSPHIFLFGAPLSFLWGWSGIEIFAYHQGFFFALFFVSLYLMFTRASLRYRDRTVAILAAVLIGALSNVLLQAAAYPHYEIATFALSSVALAAWVSDHRLLFLLSLLWLPLIREDGGLYAAFTCLVCNAFESASGRDYDLRTRKLAILAVSAVIVSGCAFTIKAMFFPGFDAFAGNFAGRSWDHLTAGFLAERLRAMIGNANILPVLVGSALLAAFDVRYATGVVLLSPVYLLHLLSVRPEHGYFTLYYALPWLLAWVTCLALFVKRSRASATYAAESILILILSVAMTAPMHAAVGVSGQSWYVAKWSVTRPVVNIPAMKDFALWIRQNYPGEAGDAVTGQKYCASMGIAALIPNDMKRHEVLDLSTDLSKCRTVLLLLRGEADYRALRADAAAQKFKLVASRDNAELWFRDTN